VTYFAFSIQYRFGFKQCASNKFSILSGELQWLFEYCDSALSNKDGQRDWPTQRCFSSVLGLGSGFLLGLVLASPLPLTLAQ